MTGSGILYSGGQFAVLHRLALEPGRLWKRYMIFTPVLIVQALAERSGLL